MSVRSPPRFCFDPLKLFIFYCNAEPDLAFHSIADPDPACKKNADPDPQPCFHVTCLFCSVADLVSMGLVLQLASVLQVQYDQREAPFVAGARDPRRQKGYSLCISWRKLEGRGGEVE